MRWQEEVTLTGYEMQWTVRYFLYMSRKWVIPPPASGISFDSLNLSKGAIAYWNRKRAVWEEFMRKADRKFRGCHPAYESPL